MHGEISKIFWLTKLIERQIGLQLVRLVYLNNKLIT